MINDTSNPHFTFFHVSSCFKTAANSQQVAVTMNFPSKTVFILFRERKFRFYYNGEKEQRKKFVRNHCSTGVFEAFYFIFFLFEYYSTSSLKVLEEMCDIYLLRGI